VLNHEHPATRTFPKWLGFGPDSGRSSLGVASQSSLPSCNGPHTRADNWLVHVILTYYYHNPTGSAVPG
jgi:hypothetical protein